MRISGGNVLATLRRWRHRIVTALLPALLLTFATGSSCLARSMGHGLEMRPSDAQPMQAAPMAHMGHVGHMAQHDAPAVQPEHVPSDPTCPHCQTQHQPAAASHSACGVSDISSADGTLGKYTAADVTLPSPAAWAPLPLTPAPPLIRAAPSRGAITSAVPLNIRHCVLLI